MRVLIVTLLASFGYSKTSSLAAAASGPGCNPNSSSGLLCNDGTVGRASDWSACGVGKKKFSSRKACPNGWFTCGNGKCAKSSAGCQGFDGVKFTKQPCPSSGGEPGCHELVAGCKNDLCIRRRCDKAASCAMSKVNKKVVCVDRSSVTAEDICAALTRRKNAWTRRWCKTEPSCALKRGNKFKLLCRLASPKPTGTSSPTDAPVVPVRTASPTSTTCTGNGGDPWWDIALGRSRSSAQECCARLAPCLKPWLSAETWSYRCCGSCDDMSCPDISSPAEPTAKPTIEEPTSPPSEAGKNKYVKDTEKVGAWGGTCTCPDGSTYDVGDNKDSCASLACEGGRSGPCEKKEAEKRRGMRVTCAGTFPPTLLPTRNPGAPEKLVWSDDFSGREIDQTKWNLLTWPAYKVNAEQQAYTPRKDNVFIRDGKLVIRAQKEDYDGAKFTSARVTSDGKGDWLYGRFETRAKLPTGPAGTGTWPAIWMLPTDWEYGQWPNSGEIDIMEHVACDNGRVHATVHTQDYNHMIGTQVGKSTWIGDGVNGVGNWHVYGLEWGPDKIVGLVDGKAYFEFKREGTSDPKKWPFNRRFHFVLNVAVGGNWGGYCLGGRSPDIPPAGTPEASAMWRTSEMQIDWVRVYSYDDLPPVSEPKPTPTSPPVDEPTAGPNPKRGIARADLGSQEQPLTALKGTAVSWANNWGVSTGVTTPSAYSSNGIEFIPMVWGETSSTSGIPEGSRALLGFNEPNHKAQSDLTPAEVARLWPKVVTAAEENNIPVIVGPSLTFGSGVSDPPNRIDPWEWYDEFFRLCPDCRVDAIAFHSYNCNAEAIEYYVERYKKYGRPLWLTEFACGDDPQHVKGGNPEKSKGWRVQCRYIQDVVPYLDNEPLIERYSWFSYNSDYTGESSLINEATGELTPLGECYVGA